MGGIPEIPTITRISQISRFDKLNDYDDEANKYSQWYYGPKTRFAQSITIKKKKKTKLFDNVSIIGAWQKTNESRHKQKVCIYWLQSQCKKGDSCPFLHVYDKEKLPVCRFYYENGEC